MYAGLAYSIRATTGLLLLGYAIHLSAQPNTIVDVYQGPQSSWPDASIDKGISFKPLGALSKEPIFPDHNPYSKEKYELGKQLFFDRRLSKSEQISCASCHDPDLGWADGKRKSIGHNRLQHQLNSPSVLNSAWVEKVFWDGRAHSLEQQILETWQNPIEMAAHLPTAVARIKAIDGYKPFFVDAFGSSKVTANLIAKAIGTFMRTLTLSNTRFDKFMRGDRAQLQDDEIKGLHLFRTKARCANCHNGTLLTDGKFHHLGSSFHNVGNFQGRYNITHQGSDVGGFRTAGLRGIGETRPYLHNGFIKDIPVLLTLYNNGWWQNADLPDKGNDIPTATLSPHIKKLDLSKEELDQLAAFLATLDGNSPWMEAPEELN